MACAVLFTACTGTPAGLSRESPGIVLRPLWFAAERGDHRQIISVHPGTGDVEVVADLGALTVDPPLRMVLSADDERALVIVGRSLEGADEPTGAFVFEVDRSPRVLPACVPEAWSAGLELVYCVDRRIDPPTFRLLRFDGVEVGAGIAELRPPSFTPDGSHLIVIRTGDGPVPDTLTSIGADGSRRDLELRPTTRLIAPFATSFIVYDSEERGYRWIDEMGRDLEVPGFDPEARMQPHNFFQFSGREIWRLSDRHAERVCKLPDGRWFVSGTGPTGSLFGVNSLKSFATCDARTVHDLRVPVLAGAERAGSYVVPSPDASSGAVSTDQWIKDVYPTVLVGITLDLWSFRSGTLRRIREVPPQPSYADSAAIEPRFSNDGRYLVWREGPPEDEVLMSTDLKTGEIRELLRSVRLARTEEMGWPP